MAVFVSEAYFPIHGYRTLDMEISAKKSITPANYFSFFFQNSKWILSLTAGKLKFEYLLST